MQDDGLEPPTVAAVVVTFDRQTVAARCLRAILDQDVPPGVVVLVDNGDATETELELKRRGMGLDELDGRIRLVAMEINSGPGGGFSRGFAEAMDRHPPDYLWVMDDDVVPEPGALGALLERALADGGDALYWPRVSSPDRPDNLNPGWYGVLIPSRLVERHGLPRADFVWWAEDTEYLQWRLEERAGVRSIRVPEARVHHEESSRGDCPPCWKLYYEVRNSIYLRVALKRYNYWRLIRLVAFAARQVAVHPHRVRRAALALLGASDGVRGRLGLRVALLPE